MNVKNGDKVKVHYTGKLEDGTVFDDSEKHGAPLEFEVGSGKVIPGFDKAVLGMKKGEEKDVVIEPKDGYGDPNPQFVQKIPRDQLPKDREPEPGVILALKSPDGRHFPARITEVTKDHVSIDLNHPLAGKKLNFRIKLVEIVK